jgi:hypothetical protein
MHDMTNWLSIDGSLAYFRDVRGNEKDIASYSWRLNLVRTVIPSPDMGTPLPHSFEDALEKHGSLGWVSGVADRSTGFTQLWAVTGSGTIFDRSEGYESLHRMRAELSVTDSTLLFIQTTKGRLNWMQPEDLDIDQLRAAGDAELSSVVGDAGCGGIHLCFVNGEVVEVKSSTPCSKIALLGQIASARDASVFETLGDYIESRD